MGTIENNLRLAAMNRHRKQLFGDVELTVYTMTPSAGEASAGTFDADWFAQRVENTTTAVGGEQSEWQFQIAALSDWETSQTFMKKIVALTVGSRRWTVTKIEKPVGLSLVWKVKGKEQN